MVIWVLSSTRRSTRPLFNLKLEPPSSTLMVLTRHAEKTRKAAEGGSPPADSGDEYEECTPESDKKCGTKRARTAKTTVKDKQQEKPRKKAKLSMLPDMPVDILYEVRGSLLYCISLLLMQGLPRYFPSSIRGI